VGKHNLLDGGDTKVPENNHRQCPHFQSIKYEVIQPQNLPVINERPVGYENQVVWRETRWKMEGADKNI